MKLAWLDYKARVHGYGVVRVISILKAIDQSRNMLTDDVTKQTAFSHQWAREWFGSYLLALGRSTQR